MAAMTLPKVLRQSHSGMPDTIAYGMPFLANPDLPARYRSGAKLNPPDPDTIYAMGAKGYTDYPFMTASFTY